MPWDAAILAGGQARRLDGQDKSALPIAGVPVLDRQLAALRRLTSRIVIVGGPPDRYDRVGIPVVPDLLPDIGPLGGLYTALRGASERIIVLACDLPFVTTPFLECLLRTGRDADATVPRTADGLHPLCASYAADAAPRIRRLIDEGVRLAPSAHRGRRRAGAVRPRRAAAAQYQHPGRLRTCHRCDRVKSRIGRISGNVDAPHRTAASQSSQRTESRVAARITGLPHA
jgi:molybdopterin-guanine dinucleotide biosynthesis protein A